MAVKYFYGKKEHSTTYAAASFFMPGTAAKVEAMRAKKRKLKHASSPPSEKISEAVPAAPKTPVAPPAEHVKEPADGPKAEAGTPKEEQQADIPVVLETVSTNHGEGQKSQSEGVETELVMATTESTVLEAVPDLAEQHKETKAIVEPNDSNHEDTEESAVRATTGISTDTPNSPRDVDETTEPPAALDEELSKVEQPSQAGEPDSEPTQETEQSQHHPGTNHNQVEAVDSTLVDDSNSTQDDQAPKADPSIEYQEDISVSDSTSVLSERFGSVEELVNAERAIHDQKETEVSSSSAESSRDGGKATESLGVNNTVGDEAATSEPDTSSEVVREQDNKELFSSVKEQPSDDVTPMKSSAVDESAPTTETHTADQINATPSSSTVADTTEQAHTSNPALSISTAAPDKPDPEYSPSPSSPSSLSRHASIKTSEVEWIERHEFD